MKTLLVLISLAGLVVSSGCTPDAADQADRSGEVRLCPVLRLKADGPLTVPLSISNGTDKPFIYVKSAGEVVGLDYTLRRNGKKVPRDITPGPVENVIYTPASLKAGETLSFSYELRDTILKPGEYDLQIVYRIYEGSTINLKNNATPAHFTQNYTLIVE